mmetsp:Transcript_5040/g.15134  ORF Transcript_5040/g.15134 Transcript_5040/m.15134 type:complete len:236 (-) Transcript_5040:501-1208(-)
MMNVYNISTMMCNNINILTTLFLGSLGPRLNRIPPFPLLALPPGSEEVGAGTEDRNVLVPLHQAPLLPLAHCLLQIHLALEVSPPVDTHELLRHQLQFPGEDAPPSVLHLVAGRAKSDKAFEGLPVPRKRLHIVVILLLALHGPLVSLVTADLAPVPGFLVHVRPELVPNLHRELGLHVGSPDALGDQVDREGGQTRLHRDAQIPQVLTLHLLQARIIFRAFQSTPLRLQRHGPD